MSDFSGTNCLACGLPAPDIQSVTCINDPRPGRLYAVVHDRCYSQYGMPSLFSGPEWLTKNYPAFMEKPEAATDE